MECRLEEGSLSACGLAHLPRPLLCPRWHQAQKGIQGTQAKTCSVQKKKKNQSLKRYCSLVPSFLPRICPILYEVPGYVTITGKEPGNEAYCSLGCCIYLLAFLNTYIPLLTLSLLSSHPPQCQYELLPPSLARFSPSDPNIILYTAQFS